MLRSHGQRSSSVNGVPAAIFATLASGWNASPSAYVQPSTDDDALGHGRLADAGDAHDDDLLRPRSSHASDDTRDAARRQPPWG